MTRERKAFVHSANTGKMIKEFSPMEIFMGKQYWTAWCVGQYYTIVEIKNETTHFENENGETVEQEITTYLVK